jgi:hypothetical protein
MTHTLTRIVGGIALAFSLAACGEPEKVNSLDIQIVDREDFTYSAGYGNGCRFKVQVINNTDLALAKLDAFIMVDEKFLFSISSELPPMGASIRTHDVQQNKSCSDIGNDVKLKKNICSLGSMTQEECFTILQITPPDA